MGDNGPKVKGTNFSSNLIREMQFYNRNIPQFVPSLVLAYWYMYIHVGQNKERTIAAKVYSKYA